MTPDDDIMIITDDGTIIRTGVSDIRVCGRASQGVILMRLSEGVKVIGVEKTAKEEELPDEAEADDAESENPEG